MERMQLMRWMLLCGGDCSDGEVYIMSLEKLSSPGVFTPGGPTAPQQQINEITRCVLRVLLAAAAAAAARSSANGSNCSRAVSRGTRR